VQEQFREGGLAIPQGPPQRDSLGVLLEANTRLSAITETLNQIKAQAHKPELAASHSSELEKLLNDVNGLGRLLKDTNKKLPSENITLRERIYARHVQEILAPTIEDLRHAIQDMLNQLQG